MKNTKQRQEFLKVRKEKNFGLKLSYDKKNISIKKNLRMMSVIFYETYLTEKQQLYIYMCVCVCVCIQGV